MPKLVRKTLLLAVLTFALVFLPRGIVHAQVDPTYINKNIGPIVNSYAYDVYNQSATLGNVVANVIRGALLLMGMIFLVLIIYGGYLWLTSSGNEDQVTKGKDIIRNSVIGLLILFSGYTITYFVIKYVDITTQESNTSYVIF